MMGKNYYIIGGMDKRNDLKWISMPDKAPIEHVPIFTAGKTGGVSDLVKDLRKRAIEATMNVLKIMIDI